MYHRSWHLFIRMMDRLFSAIGLKPTTYGPKICRKNEQKIESLSNFYNSVISDDKALTRGICCIIFSMNRPMQLHGLISSFLDNASTTIPIFVLFRATNRSFARAYSEIIKSLKSRSIQFVEQNNDSSFHNQLIDVLENINTDKMFFLVDDILITEKIDISEINNVDTRNSVLSLRLGSNLQTSYNADSPQPLPKFVSMEGGQTGKIRWKWNEGTFDWGYPISLDGHVFSTKEILAMTKYISFSSPNTYEGNLQIFNPIFLQRFGIAYKKSRLFNIPCNRVQTDVDNRHGDIHQDELLERWNNGYQIDFRAFYEYMNTAAHEIIGYNFIKRNHDQ